MQKALNVSLEVWLPYLVPAALSLDGVASEVPEPVET